MLVNPREEKVKLDGVIYALTDLFILRELPADIRSDNGPLAIVARTNGATMLAL